MSDPVIIKINQKPVDLGFQADEFPPAPLVFADDARDADAFNVRVVAFLPAIEEIIPVCRVEDYGDPEKVVIEGNLTVDARSFLIEYDSKYPVSSTDVNVWNISFHYRLNGEESVDYILTRVRNMDPKTSRGTVTTVQHPHYEKA